MSFKNDSGDRSASRTRNGNAKNSQAKNSGARSAEPRGQRGEKNSRSNAPASRFQANDIRTLVQNHGRARVEGQEWRLKTPSWNDSFLQFVINDPGFTAKQAGRPSMDGRVTYELRGHGKTVSVTIGR